ncbi:MAG: hypothetical protein UZ21_OP11001000278 [Microgenomates bacterium OLB22]|nr:MAG: hypothetical protein UZ21_OP11001000278 [Microgenomates bacterium OLB22]
MLVFATGPYVITLGNAGGVVPLLSDSLVLIVFIYIL